LVLGLDLGLDPAPVLPPEQCSETAAADLDREGFKVSAETLKLSLRRSPPAFSVASVAPMRPSSNEERCNQYAEVSAETSALSIAKDTLSARQCALHGVRKQLFGAN
jgi:hypothetical protein